MRQLFLKSGDPVKVTPVDSPRSGRSPKFSPKRAPLRSLSSVKKPKNNDSPDNYYELPSGHFNLSDGAEVIEEATVTLFDDAEISFESQRSEDNTMPKVAKSYLCGCECQRRFQKLQMAMCWSCNQVKVARVCGNYCRACNRARSVCPDTSDDEE